MKKQLIIMFIFAILLLQVVAASPGEAKSNWLELKDVSKEMKSAYKDAQKEFKNNKTDENKQILVDAGKDLLNAGLDEAEAWLLWKQIQVAEDPKAPEDLAQKIQEDITKNLDKIEGLRTKVDNVGNQLQLGLVFIEMVVEYRSLIADVSNNMGNAFIHKANEMLETANAMEEKLRELAEGNEKAISYLDEAKADLESAQSHVGEADTNYDSIKVPGKPLVDFHQGNIHLREAKQDFVSAHQNMKKAYKELLKGGQDEN